MSMVGFPLLLIPLAIYNIIVFLMPGVDLAAPLVTLPLMSGAQWPLTMSDVLLALGIVMLLFEVIKGARPGAKFLTDHLLSLIIFGGAVAEFLLWPRFANSTYFLLTLLSLSDFLSGVALRVRRGALATAAATRGTRRSTIEARQEPRNLEPQDIEPQGSEPQGPREPRGLSDLHAGAWPPAREPASAEPVIPAPASRAPANPAPASREPVSPVPSSHESLSPAAAEPTHSETRVAAPAAEAPSGESVPSGESKPGSGAPKPPETAH
jgi:hypothetical protein